MFLHIHLLVRDGREYYLIDFVCYKKGMSIFR